MKLIKLLLLVSGVLLPLLLLEVQILPLSSSVYRLQLRQLQDMTRAASHGRLGLETELGTKLMSETAMKNGLYRVNLVMYNRVPKTGSTSFMWVIKQLCNQLGYKIVQIVISGRSYVVSPLDQYRLIQNITTWKDTLPGFYHGHFAFIDFQRFGAKHPLYIQLIREPLDRMVSHYYFLRYGDDFAPNTTRSRMGDNTTFDECIARRKSDCSPHKLWVQVPYFCGHEAACWHPGSAWALQRAKEHLMSKYLVVGLTEQLSAFITVLEAILPQFFGGASQLFNEMERKIPLGHLRQTTKKNKPKAETILWMKRSHVYQMERQFYEFAKVHFEAMKKRILKKEGNQLVPIGKNYRYNQL